MGTQIYNYIVSKIALKVPMFAKSIVDNSLKKIGRTADNVTPSEMKTLLDLYINPSLKKYLKANSSIISLGTGVLEIDRENNPIKFTRPYQNFISGQLGLQAEDPAKISWALSETLILSCQDFEESGDDVVIKEYKVNKPQEMDYNVTIIPRYEDGKVIAVTSILQDVTLFRQLQEQVDNMYSIIEEHNKKIQFELTLASNIQKGLMPPDRLAWQGASLAINYLAKEMVGGDYYDLFHLSPDKLGVLLADVSGHGIPAALITALVKTHFSQHVGPGRDPSQVMAEVNDEIIKYVKTGDYLTAIYGILTSDFKFIYCNAGHASPILYRKRENKTYLLEEPGAMILGIQPSKKIRFENQEVQLEKGDMFFIFTDGLSENKNPEREEFGLERICSIIEDNHFESPRDAINMLMTECDVFSRGQYQDDLSIVAMQVVLDRPNYLNQVNRADEFLAKKCIRKLVMF